MFGPLPRLHRLLLIGAALLMGIASGAWLAKLTALPIAISGGVVLGAVVGSVLAYALVHDFHARPRPAHAARRR